MTTQMRNTYPCFMGQRFIFLILEAFSHFFRHILVSWGTHLVSENKQNAVKGGLIHTYLSRETLHLPYFKEIERRPFWTKKEVFLLINAVNFMGVAGQRVSLLFNSVGTEQTSCDPGFSPWRETASERARELGPWDAGAPVRDETVQLKHTTALLRQKTFGLRWASSTCNGSKLPRKMFTQH